MDLDDAVVHARRRYADARPLSRDVGDRARTVQPGGNTRSVLHFDPFPFRVEQASGCELIDIDGHRYVDLLGNYTAGLLGHDPAPVLDAVREALDSGWSLGSVHENEVRLAELLVERFDSIERIRFTNSGTEANLMALAVATHHTGRSKVVVFANGYHGGVLTFGAQPSPVTVPHEWVVCGYNDVDDVTRAFEEHDGNVAAVLVEPMQGSGGCIVGEPDFLRSLRALCDTHGSLLVFDEVMTSRFSRGGAQQLLGIRPDLTTLGKYLAGGFTFGAFGGRADVMAHFDPAAGGTLGHAGTFNNNVVSMAAGVAGLRDVLTDDVLAAVHARGDALRIAIGETFRRNSVPMSITGSGSLMNVHGTTGPVRSAHDLAEADDRLRELFFFHCLDAGFYLARRGFIALSIEVSDAQISEFLTVVDSFRIAE
ncbi:aspartate aminotransferase family protein [Ilumatobacter nonamiensis]|uniref:aspartate aminotransferase family protein n=1 Tax=Ilumatobacter nonamiensis TaxID=467093 RepID=UPI0003492CD6|nr:aminotransferase class III-fold pyridoxal phosphate-dependent enzyme [Ilumatobacter nonamiensis]